MLLQRIPGLQVLQRPFPFGGRKNHSAAIDVCRTQLGRHLPSPRLVLNALSYYPKSYFSVTGEAVARCSPHSAG